MDTLEGEDLTVSLSLELSLEQDTAKSHFSTSSELVVEELLARYPGTFSVPKCRLLDTMARSMATLIIEWITTL